MEKVSLLVLNANVFNSYLKKFIPANVAVIGKKFYYIDRSKSVDFEFDEVIDAKGMYMIPGMVDVHMHIESSMMTPSSFGHCLAQYGVTTIVSEPHEMANVKGVRGILEMISAGDNTPIDIYYGIPSSVPSTNETLETTGGIIDFDAMKHLMLEDDVVCVGEVMNYRQIIRENNLEISKFIEYLHENHPNYVIEGHCPALVDLDLAKFLYLGINGDHTEHNLEEFKQRIENGMFMEIQGKMLLPEILDYIKENNVYEYCSFVTDDTMADVLNEKGQLNYIVEQAIAMGFPLEQAIYCATYTASQRMHLFDRGVIAPGKLADFSLLKDPHILRPEFVYKNGKQIYSNDMDVNDYKKDVFPEDFYHTIQIEEITLSDFEMPLARFTDSKCDEVKVRVMEVQEKRTQTIASEMTMKVVDGKIDWKASGCMLAVVFERHGKNGNIGYGFVHGNCHKEGTIATTYFHDHHNLLVVGNNEEDMLVAAKRIMELQGGFLTCKDGHILEELPLPICGILSDGPVSYVGSKLKKIRESMKDLGYNHINPIMSVGTLGLPVSPALKLTDKGLIDVHLAKIVPLIIE